MHRLSAEARFSQRVPRAASWSLAFLVSALAFHFIFLRRAKRDLGF